MYEAARGANDARPRGHIGPASSSVHSLSET